tara:strand:+ start:817 stop:1167 length:351 start_codon:yes stop_codon:yes gene_type:complete
MDYLYLQAWLRPGSTNPTLGNLPAGSRAFNPWYTTSTGWNSDGTDLIKLGHEDDDDAYGQNADVSSATVGADFTPGVGVGYTSVARRVSATYAAGGSTPTLGFTLVVLPYIRVATN